MVRQGVLAFSAARAPACFCFKSLTTIAPLLRNHRHAVEDLPEDGAGMHYLLPTQLGPKESIPPANRAATDAPAGRKACITMRSRTLLDRPKYATYTQASGWVSADALQQWLRSARISSSPPSSAANTPLP